MSFFRAVIHLLTQSKDYPYIAHQKGRKPVKKIPANAAGLLTMKVEVESPYNRITISYNREGNRAFAVFLLSFFVGKCRKALTGIRCRSPPFNLDFYIFKNSD